MDKKCEHCKRLRSEHVTIYYGAGTYIRISVETRFVLMRISDNVEQSTQMKKLPSL